MTIVSGQGCGADDTGFAATLDRGALRRHLRMSLAVVALLAVAIAGAATSIGPLAVTTLAAGVTIPAAPVHAETNAIGAVRSRG